MAVVAERPELIGRVLPPAAQRPNPPGAYLVRLFLDGYWQATVVDAWLPCLPPEDAAAAAAGKRPPKRATKAAARGNPEGLAFSRAGEGQLWAPLLEKAYAKAHGCYSAISGGQVAEALVELGGGIISSGRAAPCAQTMAHIHPGSYLLRTRPSASWAPLTS